MSSPHFSIVDLPRDCVIITRQHAYELLNTYALAQWIPFRSLEDDRRRTHFEAIPIAPVNKTIFTPL